MKRAQVLGFGVLLSLALVGCQKAKPPEPPATPAVLEAPAKVDAQRLADASKGSTQWITYGGNYEETRFSPLKQIDTTNVGTLGLEWFADYDTNLQQTGTPLYIDGVLYVSTAWSKVYAFEAKTGKQLWKFDPRVPGEWAVKVCCGLVNRGIAAWNGKIYVGTLDGRLVAIDAKTGKPVWDESVIDKSQRYSITVAPRVVKGKVLYGPSGGEFGVRGYIAAVDAETGKEVWRFYTVPGDPSKPQENAALEKAAKTWGKGDWWKIGGGGTVWDAIVYDQVNDTIIFGTGNGTPWNARARDETGGDNLYLASIIAVKADTGEYVWHYQTVPSDTWDYDAVSPMMILNLKFGDADRRVIVQPNKNGMLYVLDAASGKLISSDAFTTVNWNTGIDMKTGRPKVVKEARYAGGSWNLAPGVQGGHGWHSNAFSPDTGLIYIPTQRAYFPLVEAPYTVSAVGYNLGIDFTAPATYYLKHPKEPSTFVGFLQAWDPVTRKMVWESQTNAPSPGDAASGGLTGGGLAGGASGNGPTGGAMATAGGLVFAGTGAKGDFNAYDARTGKVLWTFKALTGVLPGAITYELDGKQYIAASVGGNQAGPNADYFAPNHSRMLVFALGGKATLPPVQPYTIPPLNPPAQTATADVIAHGGEMYTKYCSTCHGQNGQARAGLFPNLMRTPLLHTQEGFDQVVLGGARTEKGMVSFSSVLQPADAAAIRAFVIELATKAKAAPPPAAPVVEQPHK
jgi:alcohol dehydrogenase (cytochrome c)/quinohemoprotein ethanol dehydrogenase